MKIGFQSGSSITQEEYFKQRGWDYTWKTKKYQWIDNYWSCERYRIDFTLESSKMKIAVELDGEQFHKNKNKDMKKDEYLKNNGYTVLRFNGKDVIKNTNKMKEELTNLILLKEIGFIIEKQTSVKKLKIIPKHTIDYFIDEVKN